MVFALAPVLSASLSGCIRHQATVLESPVTNDASLAIDAQAVVPNGLHHRHSAMPVEMRVSGFRLDQETGLERFEAHLTTPLPWWQRFPFDLLADWSPWQHRVSSQAIITYQPIPSISATDLQREAFEAGYGPPP